MKNVAVFFGGRSAEHDVSIITALIAVIPALETSGTYNPVPVYITQDGLWYSFDQLKDINFYRNNDFLSKLKRAGGLGIQFDNQVLLLRTNKRIGQSSQRIDIGFSAMHGTYGEDGSLMGILRMAGIPFIGCDLEGSVVAMDKVLTKKVLQSEGIKTPEYTWFYDYQYSDPIKRNEIYNRIEKLGYPLFVKPSHLGSSIGITKVGDIKGLENAIEVALHFDRKVLIEKAIENLVEVTLPIMGNQELEEAYLEEVVQSQGSGFFDFEQKYLSGGSKKGKNIKSSTVKGENSNLSDRIPAKLDPALYKAAVKVAKRAYGVVGCEGMARVDLLIDGKRGDIYVNEINPLPGSLYHHNWMEKGISNLELVEKLIDLAEERHAGQKGKSVVFKSSFLNQSF
ncbi:D-alanine--D-alanine ligase [Candidatus Saccharibacteria bacterium]|nr:D-alanine--D-alanine ligase [Candidatus Saccharibacteria bacterium]MCB9834782.1 D-alanine--D-alanine ligase [Candidatus Nomurabacteria bacterium]